MRRFAEVRATLDELYRIHQEISREHPIAPGQAKREAPWGAILQVMDEATRQLETAESLLYEVETT